MRRWVHGELGAGEHESFAEFGARVRRAVVDIVAAAGRGKTVAVVTSAGPTAIAAQLALELPDITALKQSWVVANTGVTEIKFRGEGGPAGLGPAGGEAQRSPLEMEMTLVVFNALPHLRERRLVTYR
jgi:broad specificity phosphatase PhoE